MALPEFGYVLPNSWGVPHLDDVVALAVRAEQQGAAALWVSHHVLHVGFVGERLGELPYHDPLVTLAVVAGATTHARLGTSVLVVPYLHPMPTAKTVATIDHLSRGRVVLGVGVGNLRVEHDAIGQVAFEQRGRYTDEFLDVVRLLWTPGRHDYHGRFFEFADVAAYPGPFRSEGIPLVVGGRSEGAYRRVARYGAAWHGLGLEPDAVAPVRDGLRAALAEQGRDEVPIQLRLHIDPADGDADSWAERFEAYAAAGVDEVLLAPQTTDLAEHWRWLERLRPLMERCAR